MCCVGVIDDFTQDYVNQCFRIVTKRKADGQYFMALKQFLKDTTPMNEQILK